MHINCHFDALLVLHTRTASVVGATEVQTQLGLQRPPPRPAGGPPRRGRGGRARPPSWDCTSVAPTTEAVLV
jgi:hypothetical protein